MRLILDSPVGPFGVDLDGATVVGAQFGVVESSGHPATGVEHPAVAQLAAYFEGTLSEFTVPVAIVRGSPFERAVWAQLLRIPYGEMHTYGQIAAAIGDPGAARAVGTACNRNPVPVIVPCHRVVGAGGKMVGFGGGLDRKRRLLELEARVALARAWS